MDAIPSSTHVQMNHRGNRWDLSMWLPDSRHQGTVTYTLQVKDCGSFKDRVLEIQTEDCEHYEVVSDREYKEVMEHYPEETRYITEDMAKAFGFMPTAAKAFLDLRWEAINLILTPVLH